MSKQGLYHIHIQMIGRTRDPDARTARDIRSVGSDYVDRISIYMHLHIVSAIRSRVSYADCVSVSDAARERVRERVRERQRVREADTLTHISKGAHFANVCFVFCSNSNRDWIAFRCAQRLPLTLIYSTATYP